MACYLYHRTISSSGIIHIFPWLSRQVTKLLWKKMLFHPGQFSPTAVLTANFRKGGTLPSIPNFGGHLKLTVQCFLETPLLIFDSIVRHAACRVWTGNKEWLPTAPSWKRFLYSLTQQHCHGGAQKGIWEYFFCITASKHQNVPYLLSSWNCCHNAIM